MDGAGMFGEPLRYQKRALFSPRRNPALVVVMIVLGVIVFGVVGTMLMSGENTNSKADARFCADVRAAFQERYSRGWLVTLKRDFPYMPDDDAYRDAKRLVDSYKISDSVQYPGRASIWFLSNAQSFLGQTDDYCPGRYPTPTY
jgi:hypothetical protein